MNIKFLPIVLITVVIVVFSSCTTLRVADQDQVFEAGYRFLPQFESYTRTTDANIVVGERSPDYKKFATTFFGVFPGPGTDKTGEEICGTGSKPVQIENQWHFGHAMLTALTFGVWTPTTLKVWCG